MNDKDANPSDNAADADQPKPELTAEMQAAEQELKQARERLRSAKKKVRLAQQRARQAGAPAGRDTSFGDLLDRTLALVKKHPGIGIGAAAAVGFLLGRLFRRW